MPNVRLTWQNNSTGHDGQRVRMDEPSSAGPDTVIADIGPNVEEYIALNATEPEACFTVAAYEGAQEEESAEVCVETAPGTDWDNVSIGDYVEGGVYAGVITYADSRQFHFIVSGDYSDLTWGADTNLTTPDEWDGVDNTQNIMAHGGGDGFPAAEYCDGFSSDGFDDFYLGARHEMNHVWDVLSTIPPFNEDGEWWTSTTSGSFDAYVTRHFDGGSFPRGRTAIKRVFPVRRVPA